MCIRDSTKTVEISQLGTQPMFLEVSPTDVSKTSVPGNQIFNVTSNSTWEVCTDDAWITLTPETGRDNGFFVATFSSNPSVDERVATITVKSPGLPDRNITITQGGFTPQLDADPKEFLVGSFQGIVEFNVFSNLSWNINSDASWAQPVNPFGANNETVVIQFETNRANVARTARLTISPTVPGVPEVIVTIMQDQTNATVDLEKLYDLSLYPNPVAEDLNIEFQLANSEDLIIDILDINGRLIEVISEDSFSPSKYKVSHNVDGLSSGIYLLRFKSENGVLTKRFIVE